MRFRSVAAAAAVSLSLILAGCSSNSTTAPSPTTASSSTSAPAPATSSPTGSGAATTTKSSSSSGGKTTAPSGSNPTAPAKTTTSPVVVQNPLPPATKIVNVIPKRKTVTLAACKATAGGWEATGTAANATAKPVVYTITIFFTTDKATVQDYAVAKLSVPAKSTAKWTAAKKFKAAAPTLCVLRGVG